MASLYESIMQSNVPDITRAASEGARVPVKDPKPAVTMIVNHLKHVFPSKDYPPDILKKLVEESFSPGELAVFKVKKSASDRRAFLFDRIMSKKQQDPLGFLFASFMRGPDDLGRNPNARELNSREVRKRFVEGRSLFDQVPLNPQQRSVDELIENAKTDVIRKRREASIVDKPKYEEATKYQNKARKKLVELVKKLQQSGAQDLSREEISTIQEMMSGISTKETFDAKGKLQSELVPHGKMLRQLKLQARFKKYQDAPIQDMMDFLQKEIRTAESHRNAVTAPFSKYVSPNEIAEAMEEAVPRVSPKKLVAALDEEDLMRTLRDFDLGERAVQALETKSLSGAASVAGAADEAVFGGKKLAELIAKIFRKGR